MSTHSAPTHAPAEGHGHAGHHGPHVMRWQTLVAVWVSLLFFTALTIAAAYLPLQSDFWRAAIAIVIASIKATIVALFFMHLLYDEKFNLVLLIGCFLFVVIFFAFTLMDPMTRGWVNPISEFPIHPKMDRPGSAIYDFHPNVEMEHADHATSGTATHAGGAVTSGTAHMESGAPPLAEAPVHGESPVKNGSTKGPSSHGAEAAH